VYRSSPLDLAFTAASTTVRLEIFHQQGQIGFTQLFSFNNGSGVWVKQGLKYYISIIPLSYQLPEDEADPPYYWYVSVLASGNSTNTYFRKNGTTFGLSQNIAFAATLEEMPNMPECWTYTSQSQCQYATMINSACQWCAISQYCTSQMTCPSCNLNCGTHGNCSVYGPIPNTGPPNVQCVCDPLYTNSTCQTKRVCDLDCNGNNGVCTFFGPSADMYCKCNTGYQGENCYQACLTNCGSYGRCSLNTTCTCMTGFTGTYCDEIISGSAKLNPGEITAIVLCSIFGIFIIIGLVLFYRRRISAAKQYSTIK